MKMDLHIHTRFSRTKRWGSASLIQPVQLLDRVAELGLDGLAVTDHDEIEGSLLVAKLAPGWGLVAVPGVEVSSAGGHILALGVTQMIPAGLPPADTIRIIHELGGIAVAAHPLNVVVSLRKNDIIALPVDALEVHNARSPRNRKAAKLRAMLRLGATGGSDAHAIAEVGAGITEIGGITEIAGITETANDCSDYRQVIEAIRSRRTFAHGTRARYRHIAHSCIHTAAKQKKDKIKERILVSLGI